MKFVLLMHVPNETVGYASDGWDAGDWQRHMDYWRRLNQDLKDRGEFVSVHALTAPSDAKLVRVRPDGLPDTDGPFAESKEFLAGFWTIEVPSAERAYEIAAQASAAPGHGGAPLNMPIEVRAVGVAPTT